MGSGRFDHVAYRSFSASTATKSTEEIYRARGLKPSLDPKGVKVRESRDSADNPNSTPLIVALDVTGSMGMLADEIAREGLGTLFQGIFDRKPITDPHVMFMGIGDANCDSAPLQVSQFEAATPPILSQLQDLWLEKGGGGNSFESYNLAWFFAGFHTVHDASIKRGKRGYLFTVGDEEIPGNLTNEQILRITGDTLESNLDSVGMLRIAQRTYDVYHIIIEQGSHARSHLDRVKHGWREILGQKAISLADYKALAETIVATIEVAEGGDAKTAASAWGAKASIVHAATAHLAGGKPPPLLGA
jgi:hypothetical protein